MHEIRKLLKCKQKFEMMCQREEWICSKDSSELGVVKSDKPARIVLFCAWRSYHWGEMYRPKKLSSPVLQVFFFFLGSQERRGTVEWIDKLVILLWQHTYERPFHAAKDCKQSETLPNNLGYGCWPTPNTIFYPLHEGRQFHFMLFIQTVCWFLPAWTSGFPLGMFSHSAARKFPRKQSHAHNQSQGSRNTYQGIPLCSHHTLWAIRTHEQADSLI